MLFWSWVGWTAWSGSGSQQMAAWDFLVAALPSFCFLLETIERSLSAEMLRTDPRLHIFGLYVGFIFVYKVLVLETADMIAKRLLKLPALQRTRLCATKRPFTRKSTILI